MASARAGVAGGWASRSGRGQAHSPGACRCREECPVGHFGQDCAEKCDCTQGARCFPANGACLCEHGFTGDRCTERLCPDGLYGLSCQEPCTCDPEHSLRWAAGHWSKAQEALGVPKSSRGMFRGRTDVTEGKREEKRPQAWGRGRSRNSAEPPLGPRRGVRRAVCGPRSERAARLRPQLPPDERGVLVPAGLGWPPLQRELPARHARARLPGALPLPARRRLPARQRPLPVRARLHGETRPAARPGAGEAEEPAPSLARPPPAGPALRQSLPARHLRSQLLRTLLLRECHHLLAHRRLLRLQGR